MIDVRNFNESLIGKFAPPDNATGTIDTNNLGMPGSSKVLDPGMRKSTDFPQWVEEHQGELEGKKVLMYCTAEVRCERASAFIRKKLNRDEVYQLDGGIHRYLEEYKEDAGIGSVRITLRQAVRTRRGQGGRGQPMRTLFRAVGPLQRAAEVLSVQNGGAAVPAVPAPQAGCGEGQPRLPPLRAEEVVARCGTGRGEYVWESVILYELYYIRP